jgi:hypothetical protein
MQGQVHDRDVCLVLRRCRAAVNVESKVHGLILADDNLRTLSREL